MDSHNTFETKATAGLARLEWGGLLVTCAVLTLLHWNQVDWVTFVALFAIIDAIGYLPGAVAFRRSGTGDISRVYYALYNAMHCLTTWTLILGVWVVWSGWQWAFLAVPLHLLGDRALFGNSLKPFGVSFEPKTHPEFAAFRARYGAAEARRLRRTDAAANLQVDSARG
jgi:hypothetical protein